MKKSHKIALIITSAVVGTMLVMGIIAGGLAFYFASSRDYCGNYAKNNEQKTGLPEGMSFNSLYEPCMDERGFGSFAR